MRKFHTQHNKQLPKILAFSEHLIGLSVFDNKIDTETKRIWYKISSA